MTRAARVDGARRAATASTSRCPASAGSPATGPSASISASRRTRAGAAAATTLAIAPPIECPSQSARSQPSASIASSTSWIQSTNA
jgi:hypothetical protein